MDEVIRVEGLTKNFGSLRVLSRTGGLARTFPFSTRQLRNATMIVPSAAQNWMRSRSLCSRKAIR